MAKIIKIHSDIVSIGNSDGSITDVAISDLNFTPQIGDEVEFFSNDEKIIVNKIGAQHRTNAEGKRAVNKLAYALLAILVGGIGIHKFYAGKIGMGFVYILFCWTAIPSIIGLIEGIIALTKPEDNNGNIYV